MSPFVTKLKNYFTAALGAAVLVLGFMQYKSCGSAKVIKDLNSDKETLLKQRDSSGKVVMAVMQKDSSLRIMYSLDTTILKAKIDSISKVQVLTQQKYADIKSQLKQTVADLSSSVSLGDTTKQLLAITQLKNQLESASDLINFMQATGDDKDSLLMGELHYRDSVISEKNSTIDSLKQNYDALQILLNKSIADLNTAIAQLKKNKSTNVLRTIGEAILVVALIVKSL